MYCMEYCIEHTIQYTYQYSFVLNCQCVRVWYSAQSWLSYCGCSQFDETRTRNYILPVSTENKWAQAYSNNGKYRSKREGQCVFVYLDVLWKDFSKTPCVGTDKSLRRNDHLKNIYIPHIFRNCLTDSFAVL